MAGFRERFRRAADETGIAVVLQQRGTALGFPAGGFEAEESLEGRCDVFGLARHIETDGAVLRQPVALATQFLQFLGAQGVTQQLVGIAGRVEGGANVGMQQSWTHAVWPQDFGERLHDGAIQRDVAQDQRMGAGFARRLHQLENGFIRHIAINQRRAQRAVGIGAHQRGQRNFVGAPQRNRRQKADQSGWAVGRQRGVAPRAQRGYPGPALRRGIHRQFPVGQIITVRLGGAPGERPPSARGNGRERRERVAIGPSRRLRPLSDDILHGCAMDHG